MTNNEDPFWGTMFLVLCLEGFDATFDEHVIAQVSL